MECIIISNGSFIDYQWAAELINNHDMIICADGGAKHLFNMDLLPHYIMGDLDSIDLDTKTYYVGQNVKFIEYPIEKDFTDTELAIDYAIRNGAKKITLLGATGSRLDHTLANITLLVTLLDREIEGKIIDNHNEITVTKNSVEVTGKPGDLLSILPLCDIVEGVSLIGLEYPLDNFTLKMGSSIGISNKFVNTKAKIMIKSGKLLIIKARD